MRIQYNETYMIAYDNAEQLYIIYNVFVYTNTSDNMFHNSSNRNSIYVLFLKWRR